MNNIGKIIAEPNKEFFIEMLTKDINIDKAIFDLIDNSIDAAKEKKHKINEKIIKITINEEKFIIYDNCGGIVKEDAIKYAFNFGRSKEYRKDNEESIGRFGVGMKRAIFKMGNKFEILTNDGTQTYKIKQDIQEWEKSEKWEFKFEDTETDEINRGETKITINELYSNIKNDFKLIDFIENLKKQIRIYYSIFLIDGLKIFINEDQIKAKDFNLIYKKDVLEPQKIQFNIKDVKCTIISGLAKAKEGEDDDPVEAGWYIYCNNRLVLMANKDIVTGWGQDGVSVFHNTYAMFRGIVLFEASNSENLPINTTKSGIDEGNDVYITAKRKMSKVMKEQFKFLRKINKTENLNSKKKIRQMESISLFKSYKDYQYKSNLIINNEEILPKKNKNPKTKISFYVEEEKYELVKNELGVTKSEDVGLKIFDYYIKMNEL